MVLLGRVLTQQSDDLELEGAPEDEETDSVSQLKSIGGATVTTLLFSALGVPLTTPAELRVRPAGNVPLAVVQV